MFKDISPEAPAKTVRQARKLRRRMSLPEVLLWRALRSRPGGLKFRRQHPSGPYTIDFFCSDARLIVEIDGGSHDADGRPARDERRDAYFSRVGLETLRVAAEDVLDDVDAVTRGIVNAARMRLPLHQPAAGPPPRDKLGED